MIHDFFKGIGELYTKEFELAAIWLDKPLQTATERTVRITEGHQVAIIDGKLSDCIGNPTHKVIGCYGTLNSSSLSFLLTDLKTNEPLIYKIK